MPYTRRNASPYVPSPSETDLKAKNVGITQSLTASNVSTLNLSVLGNVNGVLNLEDGVKVSATLKVPTVITSPIDADITNGPTQAGLITIVTTAAGKMYFSKERDNVTGQSARDLGVTDAKTASTGNTTKSAKLTLIAAEFASASTFDPSIPKDYGVRQVYTAASSAAASSATVAAAAGAADADAAVAAIVTDKAAAIVAIDAIPAGTGANAAEYDAAVATVRTDVVAAGDLAAAKIAAAAVSATKATEVDTSAGADVASAVNVTAADHEFSEFEWVLSSTV